MNSMPLQAVIFDLDGTLVDSMPLHHRIWVQALATVGLEFPEELFYRLGGWTTREIIRRLALEQGKTVDVDSLADLRDRAFREHRHEAEAIPEIVGAARHFHGHLPLAIATGGTRAQATAILTRLGLLELFPVLVCAEDTRNHKPHPEPFLRAADLLGVEPSACLVYEDTDAGLAAAEAAGMRAIDVRKVRRGLVPALP
jgi:beta-phosphoglucomutase family hydrolase